MPDVRIKSAVIVAALAGVAAGAIAQDRPESILPPGFDQPAPAPAPAPAPPPKPAPRPAVEPGATNEGQGDRQGEVSQGADADLEDAVDLADQDEDDGEAEEAVRSSSLAVRFGDSPWGRTRQQYLTRLMRGLDAPFALRWAHIGLRNALLAEGGAPAGMSAEHWLAERSWLLLRMGEADAARLLYTEIPKSAYDDRIAQIALQSSLASSDLAAMCPVPSDLDDAEPVAEPLVDAICAALSGQPEIASDAINSARRRGRMGGIDLALAEKLVGAGSATARAVTLEWDPVTSLTAWRYGLATATGTELPPRLLDDAQPQLWAWYARAPLIGVQQRLPAARVATGMGVFSGQALTDLLSDFYDSGDADAVASSEAVVLRRAFVASDVEDRLQAMRTLWSAGDGDALQRRAGRALVGRAAARLVPGVDFESDSAELVASMFAVGLDDSAGRWARTVGQMDEDAADPAWAMLAVGVPERVAIDLTRDRIDDFGSRDKSSGKHRAKLLIAGLAGLGRIDQSSRDALDGKYEIGLSRSTKLTRDLDAAARRGEAGTVMLIAAVAMQGESAASLSPLHLYHLVSALRATGQDYLARMIAAEAMAPA